MKKALSKNNFSKSFFTIILLLTLIFCGVNSSYSFPESTTQSGSKTEQILEKSVQLNSNEQLSPSMFKEDSFFNPKTGFLKFFLAMFGVLIASLVIFLTLKLYKKIALGSSSANKNSSFEDTLETPKDLKHAINIFLHKTDK